MTQPVDEQDQVNTTQVIDHSILTSPMIAPAAEEPSTAEHDIPVKESRSGKRSLRSTLSKDPEDTTTRPVSTSSSRPTPISKSDMQNELKFQESLICRQVIKFTDHGDGAKFDSLPLFAKQAHFRNTVFAIRYIIEQKLYLIQYRSVEEYFRLVWTVSRAQVYRLMDCCTVLDQLVSPEGDDPLSTINVPIDIEAEGNHIPSLKIPFKERICRGLKIISGGNEYAARYVWAKTLETHPDETTLNSTVLQQVWEATPVGIKKDLDAKAMDDPSSSINNRKRSAPAASNKALIQSLRGSYRAPTTKSTKPPAKKSKPNTQSSSGARKPSSRRPSTPLSIFNQYQFRDADNDDQYQLTDEHIQSLYLDDESIELSAADEQSFSPIASRIQALLQGAQALSDMDDTSSYQSSDPSSLRSSNNSSPSTLVADAVSADHSIFHDLVSSCIQLAQCDEEADQTLETMTKDSIAAFKTNTTATPTPTETEIVTMDTDKDVHEIDVSNKANDMEIMNDVNKMDTDHMDVVKEDISVFEPPAINPPDDSTLFLGFVMAVRAGRTMAF